MSYLLDTCTLIWLASEPERLSSRAAALVNSGVELYLSDTSVWEICLKWKAGKIQLPQPPRVWCESQAATWQLIPLAIARPHLYRTVELPPHHCDPFDRLLIGQAIERNFTIITPDELIHKYPVDSLWL